MVFEEGNMVQMGNKRATAGGGCPAVQILSILAIRVSDPDKPCALW